MNTRFNFNSTTIKEAKEYIYCRSIQLLKHYFKLIEIKQFYYGISAYYEHEGKKYQSIYILEQYRNKGLYGNNIEYTIVCSKECNIESYLINKNIDYISLDIVPYKEYEIIEKFYGDKKANRSGVYLMNHIDEGLYILNKINASDIAKKAYCLHPILQSDDAIVENYNLLENIDTQVLISLVEYRSVANEYLSHRNIDSYDEIRLSPLKDVNDMLIADKIQNKKDFDKYHINIHPRSDELYEYFNNWFSRLNINYKFYTECFEYLNINRKF